MDRPQMTFNDDLKTKDTNTETIISVSKVDFKSNSRIESI